MVSKTKKKAFNSIHRKKSKNTKLVSKNTKKNKDNLSRNNSINKKKNNKKKQIGGVNFPELIKSLKDISRQINEIYKGEDKNELLFLCLGATPAYLYTYLNKCYKYNVINIPISGLSLIFAPNYYSTVSDDQNKKFCDYLNKFLKLSYWPRYAMQKLIIIDHSHTGKSISNFIKLITKCQFNFNKIDFCNLVDKVTPNALIKKPTVELNKIHFIKASGINDMSGHIYPRATHQLHFTNIVNSSPEEINSILLDTSSIKDGLELQEKIIAEAECDKNSAQLNNMQNEENNN
jgi:hypothetical protein